MRRRRIAVRAGAANFLDYVFDVLAHVRDVGRKAAATAGYQVKASIGKKHLDRVRFLVTIWDRGGRARSAFLNHFIQAFLTCLGDAIFAIFAMNPYCPRALELSPRIHLVPVISDAFS